MRGMGYPPVVAVKKTGLLCEMGNPQEAVVKKDVNLNVQAGKSSKCQKEADVTARMPVSRKLFTVKEELEELNLEVPAPATPAAQLPPTLERVAPAAQLPRTSEREESVFKKPRNMTTELQHEQKVPTSLFTDGVNEADPPWKNRKFDLRCATPERKTPESDAGDKSLPSVKRSMDGFVSDLLSGPGAAGLGNDRKTSSSPVANLGKYNPISDSHKTNGNDGNADVESSEDKRKFQYRHRSNPSSPEIKEPSRRSPNVDGLNEQIQAPDNQDPSSLKTKLKSEPFITKSVETPVRTERRNENRHRHHCESPPVSEDKYEHRTHQGEREARNSTRFWRPSFGNVDSHNKSERRRHGDKQSEGERFRHRDSGSKSHLREESRSRSYQEFQDSGSKNRERKRDFVDSGDDLNRSRRSRERAREKGSRRGMDAFRDRRSEFVDLKDVLGFGKRDLVHWANRRFPTIKLVVNKMGEPQGSCVNLVKSKVVNVVREFVPLHTTWKALSAEKKRRVCVTVQSMCTNGYELDTGWIKKTAKEIHNKARTRAKNDDFERKCKRTADEMESHTVCLSSDGED